MPGKLELDPLSNGPKIVEQRRDGIAEVLSVESSLPHAASCLPHRSCLGEACFSSSGLAEQELRFSKGNLLSLVHLPHLFLLQL